MYKNRGYLPIPTVQRYFTQMAGASTADDILEQLETPWITQLDYAINFDGATLKMLHPLFFQGYRTPSNRAKESKPEFLGLDVETNATTGYPKMFGFYHPDTGYMRRVNPTLDWFGEYLLSLRHSTHAHLIAWGNLDLQVVIRLFNPTEPERKQISRGISASVNDGKFIATPPVVRDLPGGEKFYIASYIPGRALKLGILEGEREWTTWVYNAHQFYPGTIAQTAKGLGLPWKTFAKETHVIDWVRFEIDTSYAAECVESNKQDAVTVWSLADRLLDTFYDVFKVYPLHLISTGSLCDASVSALCDGADYASQNMEWLARDIWAKNSTQKAIDELRLLCAEGFSAGYVDQYAVGYAQEMHHADISAAYPFQIRKLHDLRYSSLIYGSGDVLTDAANNAPIESAIIRGLVTIPSTLRYHPITVKTSTRQNIRPSGTFWASYTLEEREFCRKYGASFEQEEYVIVKLTKQEASPLAMVSTKLGQFRTETTAERNTYAEKSEKWVVYDSRQYLIKVVDNSLYGKTVMSTERVENDKNGVPRVTGYTPGDRYNPLWGCLITGRTRTLLAEAAMMIEAQGGTIQMCMTDSLFWTGKKENLPMHMIRTVKTPGYFEPVETLQEFYLLKTGQYEYKDRKGWHYKLRGLPIQYEILHEGTESFYRKLLQEYAQHFLTAVGTVPHGKDVSLAIPTRRLMSVGGHDLDRIGALMDTETVLYPFRLGSKQTETFIKDWLPTLSGLTPLAIPEVSTITPAQERPLTFLSTLYRMAASDNKPNPPAFADGHIETAKKNYIVRASKQTGKLPPRGSRKRKPYQMAWQTLEQHFQIPR